MGDHDPPKESYFISQSNKDAGFVVLTVRPKQHHTETEIQGAGRQGLNPRPLPSTVWLLLFFFVRSFNG